MTRRPRTVIAHWPGLELFTGADLARLDEVADIADREPLGEWADPRADDLLSEAEVLLGHWGCPPIDAAVLDRAPRLGLVAYAAGTLKTTVTEAVFDRGIRVTTGAGANAEPVAEFTLAAILFANKDVFWQRDVLTHPAIGVLRQPSDVAIGNWDKTVGIVGASRIGRRVIELLGPFPRLTVQVYDPFITAAEADRLGGTKVGLDELCATADILSIHAPNLPATRGLIGARQLAAMRTGATVINTARGALVDHDALAAELKAGRLYAILDVTDPEPLPDDHVLRRLPNAFLTPHIAGSQGTELARMAAYATEEIRRYAAGEPAQDPVTRDQLDHIA